MQLSQDVDPLETAVFRALPQNIKTLGVAVSGGSDSTALLHLLAGGAKARDLALFVATVDHGLRPESGDEARGVAMACAAFGLPHQTLTWDDWDGQGNLQAMARDARYSLLADWAHKVGAQQVALGHTRDDLAETFVMRLARRAGVQGLAGMDQSFARGGVAFLRPMLTLGRAQLRAYLTRKGATWCDDPSNDDETYDRVRVRKALEALENIGIDGGVFADVAGHISAADEALRFGAQTLGQRASTTQDGDILIDIALLTAAPLELRHRVMIGALRWVSGAAYGPRATTLHDSFDAAINGTVRTLHGCLLIPENGVLRIAREVNAVGAPVPMGTLWDGRWLLTGPCEKGEISALGEDVSLCENWRAASLPRTSLMASPALRVGGDLIAAPLAGFGPDFVAKGPPDRVNFHDFLLSH